jgi:SAM-dependent methyltransferase
MSVGTPEEAVIWHDVENGAYGADLELWRELALGAGGPVLEIGCGTGRVAIDLARHGHHVLGVDIDPTFVRVLRDRATARDLEASAAVADVRNLEVTGEFALIIVPMQTIQLLEDAAERRAALESMRGVLAPRGLIAVAIVEGDAGADETGTVLGPPLPDVAEIGGWVYSSLPVELRSDGDRLVLSRLRQVVTPDGDLTDERAEISLAVLHRGGLEAEAQEAGLRPAGRREIAETEAHVGSAVVLLEAAP